MSAVGVAALELLKLTANHHSSMKGERYFDHVILASMLEGVGAAKARKQNLSNVFES